MFAAKHAEMIRERLGGNKFTLCGREMLLVGPLFHTELVLTDRLRRWGFQCHFASNMRAASDLLSSRPVDLVLCNTRLPDRSGFGLLPALAGMPVAALLCLPVEESCFWLPAIDNGKDWLGLPALLPSEFARELEKMNRSLGLAPPFTKSGTESKVA
jgi:hypothetical protein